MGGPELLNASISCPVVEPQGFAFFTDVVQVNGQIVHSHQGVQVIIAVHLNGIFQGSAKELSSFLGARDDFLKLQGQLGGKMNRLLALASMLFLNIPEASPGL